ncbi:hypothetical protein [Nocardioides montaniterrae]
MSSTAPNLNRLPRIAPRLAQAAAERARLFVVPRPATQRAPRVPFVVLISAILLVGVLGLLFFNTSMQEAAFRETRLTQQARDLDAQGEALQMQLDQLRDPQRIAVAAQRMGMIIPESPSGVIDLSTGRITGHPGPAIGTGLPLAPPRPVRPGAFDPAPVKAAPTTTTATGTATTTTTAESTATGTKKSTNKAAKNRASGAPTRTR